MLRKLVLSLTAAAGLALAGAAEPAFADRGNRGGDRNRNWDRNWDRGRDRDRDRDWNRHDRRDYRHRDRDWNLNIWIPYRSYDYRPRYDYYRYRGPAYYNAWGLAPHACRVDIEFDYWYGRPADIQIRRCANRYGEVYIVQGAQRLWRYR